MTFKKSTLPMANCIDTMGYNSYKFIIPNMFQFYFHLIVRANSIHSNARKRTRILKISYQILDYYCKFDKKN